MTPSRLQNSILELKKKKKALILAHYYVDGAVQDIADFVGDSLELARKAAAAEADIIVFCGVHFMAETATLLCPGKKVLCPAPGAGCSLADSIKADDLKQWKLTHPDGIIISYVNTTAETKAATDICCTSANAVKVAGSVIDGKRPVLFCPDLHLGTYVNRVLGADMEIWNGSCFVHRKITSQLVKRAISEYPDAEILIHPESDCSMDEEIIKHPKCFFYSTSGIIKHVKESSEEQFIIATENGVLHRIRKECPDKSIIPISESAICTHMKKLTLENLYETLLNESGRITVPENIASRALVPIHRMLEL